MSAGSSYHTLLNRARKAGLSTRELYPALATLPAETTTSTEDRVDGNGYVATVDEQGRREFRPVQEPPHSPEVVAAT
jgi:hypothetical protein